MTENKTLDFTDTTDAMRKFIHHLARRVIESIGQGQSKNQNVICGLYEPSQGEMVIISHQSK